MTDPTTTAIEKLSDRFRAFQTKDFPDFQRNICERVKGVETEMKGVHGRLKKVEANGNGITIQSSLPSRGDDSTVVEVPSAMAASSVSSGAAGLNIPWKVVFKFLGIISLVLLGLGFYIGNGNDMAAVMEAINKVTDTTAKIESQVDSLEDATQEMRIDDLMMETASQ